MTTPSYLTRPHLACLVATAVIAPGTLFADGSVAPPPTASSNAQVYRLRIPPLGNHPNPEIQPGETTCNAATEDPSPELYPGDSDAETHLRWFGHPGTLYTVEVSVDHLGWQFADHATGTGETVTFYPAESVGPLGGVVLVRLNTFPDPGADPDGDGLDTRSEATVFHTDPYRADTDGDGLFDGYELAAGTDPGGAHGPSPSSPAAHTRLAVHRPLRSPFPKPLPRPR